MPLVLGGYLMKKYEPHDKQGRAIAFQAFDNHAFFYKDARSLFKMNVRDFNLARPGLTRLGLRPPPLTSGESGGVRWATD